MSSPKEKSDDDVYKRYAAEALVTEARMERERPQLDQRIEEFTRYFTTTTQAALERLERKGFPGGDLYKFPDEAKEIVAWRLPHNDIISYYLATDGSIRKLNPLASLYSRWSIITPEIVRHESLERFNVLKGIDWGTDHLVNVESVVKRCNLICPTWRSRLELIFS